MTSYENEDADPVGPAPHDPRQLFTGLAVRSGVIRQGDDLSQALMDLCGEVVDACASIADAYGDGEAGGNAGEHIRAQLREH